MWARYKSAINVWKAFAETCKINWASFYPNLTTDFIVWCRENKNLCSGTIKVYLGALKIFHQLKSEIKRGRGVLVERTLLRGVDKEKKRQEKKKIQKAAPVDLEILGRIKNGLRKLRLNKGGRLCVWAVSLVAFWGAFRLGELLTKNSRFYDKFSELLWDDVRIDARARKVELKIKAGKVLGPPGNSAELFEIKNSPFCPLKAIEKLERYQKTSGIWAEHLPVFRRGSGKSLTKNRFIKTVRRALSAVGTKNVLLSCKSFRSGMLSALKTLPLKFQETHLKSLGRWKGDSYKFYLWKGPIAFADTFRSVAENLLKDFECRRNHET
jgi:hypothetical protein